jgi:hypothetical protein
MRESIILRVSKKHAWRVFAPDEGLPLETVRKIEIPITDPRLPEIGRLDRELGSAGEGPLFFGWEIRRRYLSEELSSAEVLHLWPSAVFEPAGEETGTIYDEEEACVYCGAGRRQVGDLCLDVRRIPKRADLAATVADELVFSARAAGILIEHSITGLEFRPVRQRGRGQLIAGDWVQPIVTSQPVSVTPPTQYGIDPFNSDPAGEYRCPLGHTLGLNLISELYLDRSTWDQSDFGATRHLVGVRRGLLRPRPSLLVSQRLYQLLAKENLRGFKVEVAHLV